MKSTDFIHSCWILKWDENKIFQKETTLSISNSSYRTYVGTNFVGKRPISIATHLPITVAIGREDITTRRDKQTEGQQIIFCTCQAFFTPLRTVAFVWWLGGGGTSRAPKFRTFENIRELFIITRTLSENFSRKLFSSSK